MKLEDIELIQTCGACPEQYEAYVEDDMAAYLRLRHGYFSVQCPDVNGCVVYTANPKGDGIFEDDEREYFLNAAKICIVHYHNNLSQL